MALMRTPQGKATPIKIDIDTELPRFENKNVLESIPFFLDRTFRHIYWV
jgi:hypothetical protein